MTTGPEITLGRDLATGSGGPIGVDLPDRATFAADARGGMVPVRRRLLADGETPVSIYRKLAANRPGTFLLESAELGRTWSRYSFVGVRSAATLTERDGSAVWLGEPPDGVPLTGDPLAVLRGSMAALNCQPQSALPPLTGGLVGYLGYDLVRRLERLPDKAEDDLHLPELSLLLATDVAVLDHADGTILLVANAGPIESSGADAAYDAAIARLDEMTAALTAPTEPTASVVDLAAPARFGQPAGTRDRYLDDVERIRELIYAGDAFQVVLSQRFEQPTSVGALDLYRVLRLTNPSPYMYLIRFDDFDVVGSSPEALVKVDAGQALLHPIAGSRPRGQTVEQDAALAAELVADTKERAEHLMLVDLGRNDLGRVCEPGSVDVVDFMTVERFSHVMHLVSTVVGVVRPELSALDVLLACFPAGTLSGAPKPRAMEIIEELEPTRRGLYGGAVGYLDLHGNVDTAIAIRTALLRDGIAYVQAGAGIVADSVSEQEDAECRAKAAAVLRAIAAAESLQPVGVDSSPPPVERSAAVS
jgi:anthranilate synthase component 1